MKTSDPVIIFLHAIDPNYPARLLHKLRYTDTAPHIYAMHRPQELEDMVKRAGNGFRIYISDCQYKGREVKEIVSGISQGEVVVLTSDTDVEREFKKLANR